eukprot:TRINITY_DN13234_c0_g1_i1.p1 TRINITY_DN13234_c0_g1~~TRINITY_DN13234_c0_g1_i1.p1  ORF type:complete len:492 (-),score=77.07 TRINITY_DN13234_c0_g1_i1:26-1501(-)
MDFLESLIDFEYISEKYVEFIEQPAPEFDIADILLAISTTWSAIGLWAKAFYPLIYQLFVAIFTLFQFITPFFGIIMNQIKELFFYCWPYIKQTSITSYEKALELDPLIIAGIVAGVIVLIVLYIIYRKLKELGIYQKFKSGVSVVYDKVTTLNTTGLFMVQAILFSQIIVTIYFFPESVIKLSESHTVSIIGVVVPVFFSFRASYLYSKWKYSRKEKVDDGKDIRINDDGNKDKNDKGNNKTIEPLKFSKEEQHNIDRMMYWIRYWISFSFLYFITNFVIIKEFLDQLPYVDVIWFYYIIWTLLPITKGSMIITDYIILPILGKYFKIKIDPNNYSNNYNFILNILVTVKVVSPETRERLSDFMSNTGNIIIIGSIFFITPTVFTAIGCLLVSIAYPTYASIYCIQNYKYQSNPKYVLASINNWLNYWMVFASFTLLYKYIVSYVIWFPLFPFTHVELGLLICLQLPYINVPQRVIAFLTTFYSYIPLIS